MIRAIIGSDLGTLTAVYLALLLFGIGYNWLTSQAEKTGFIRGYTSMFVVAGVAVTVVATAVISPAFALVTAGAFAASGTPMIVGSIWRHMKEREHELDQLRREAKDDDTA